jgi:uncharacterized protein (DUF1800 family)
LLSNPKINFHYRSNMPVPASTKTAWKPYEPSESAPWNLERVVHLHRRAAFAAPWEVLQRDLEEGPEASIQRLLNPPADDAFELLATTIGDAATASGSPERLKAWWLYRMLKSPDPLRERLALIWHNHFATSNRKVQNLVTMREQNDLFRQQAMAPFGELLAAVVKHPAMLAWLDADSNRKGHPNENLARELLELFTLGVGNFSERDVREAARALTGWTIVSGKFGYRELRHDDSRMEVLGRSGQLTGDDLLLLLLDHPATAQRLAWRLSINLLGEGVATEVALAELADELHHHNLDIGWGIEVVLRSELFFSTANLRTRVVGPVEHAVGVLRSLELCNPLASTLLVADWCSRMGQELFYPPNVGGWNEGRAWLSSRAIIAKANFAQSLVEGELWRPTRRPDIQALVRRYGAASDLDGQLAWLSELLSGAALPEAASEIVGTPSNANPEAALSQMLLLLLTRPESYLS